MSPSFTPLNTTHLSAGYAVSLANSGMGTALIADARSIGGGDFGCRVLGATMIDTSSPGIPVAHVIGVRPDIEVVRIHTGTNVAPVERLHSFGDGLPGGQLKNNAARPPGAPVHREQSVPIPVTTSYPDVAPRHWAWLPFRIKSLLKRHAYGVARCWGAGQL